MSWPCGFLPAPDVRAYRAAHRHAATIGQHRVLDELERCQRKYGQATPSVKGIAERCRVSPRTVIRATQALKDAGRLWIDQDRPYCDGGRWRRARTNRYRIRHAPRNPWSHRGDTDDTSKPLTGCNSTAPRPVDPVDNPSDPRAGPDPRPSDDGPVVPPPWRTLGIRPRDWKPSD